MHILYVSQYFPPEMGAPSARVYELSREWVRLGHEVTVLTAFPNHPTGVKSPGDRWKWIRREEKDGINVIRSYIYAVPNKGVFRRMLSFFSFMVSSFLAGSFCSPRPDLVIATSPQLLCALSGYLLSLRFRRPFVFEVRDLWPESIIAVAAMRDGLLIRALKSLSRFLYCRCRLIVTVGDGYRRQIIERYGILPDKIRVIPNGIDPDLFFPGPKENEIRKKWKLDNQKIILYIGTLGMAHSLRTVMETAWILKNKKSIVFFLVGEGAEKESLKILAKKWSLSNVHFVDQQSKESVVEFYKACDLGLVTLRNTPLFQDVLPSKIFEYLAMERPVIITVGGEAKKLVESSRGGIYSPPEDSKALAQTIKDTLARPTRLKSMGKAGRKFVLNQYNRKKLASHYLDFLENF